MCGRFALFSDQEDLTTYYEAEIPEGLQQRYNISPTQKTVALRQIEGEKRTLSFFHWGLVPFWAKDNSMAARMINARLETVGEKPSFRLPIKKRRCVIPASGFFEWKQAGKNKQPYFISRADGQPMSFAGLWDTRIGDDGLPFDSCSILTTSANEDMAAYHERMPVLLEKDQISGWIDPGLQESAKAIALLHPFAKGNLRIFPVSIRVNKPVHDDKECVQPLTDG